MYRITDYMKTLQFCLSLILVSFLAVPFYGQIHIYPNDGQAGVPGPVPRSFVIGWQHFEGAVNYQYVVSDNPLCFSGCAGDTREGFVADSFVVEFNLEPNRWYYWITRIHFASGDSSAWTLISSFFTEGPEDQARILTVAPNPVAGDQVRLRVDWGLNPDARKIQLKLFNQQGNLVKNGLIAKESFVLRFEDVQLPIDDLPSGIYHLRVLVDDNLNNSNNFFTLKVVVAKE